MAGVKHDSGKLPYHLISPWILRALAVILGFGAKKYSARNWEQGMDWSRVFGALQRHTWAWWEGENVDPETGESHLWHAACCIMFLVDYEARGVGKDDRPNTPIKEDPTLDRPEQLELPFPTLDDPLAQRGWRTDYIGKQWAEAEQRLNDEYDRRSAQWFVGDYPKPKC